MVIDTRKPKRRAGGWMILEAVVAMGILAAVAIPISFSFQSERKACRASYNHAIAMELVDGEMEILRAGEWRQFHPGSRPYSVKGAAAKNLPAGHFVLTVEQHLIRLEWLPDYKDQGGKVMRETPMP
ncbi:MAG TPA: hypothetical protein VH595_23310 [Verrucomicrobiae bacterium]|jgi:hypothetical protein|nr:hypothetical protein [Verrucomicrobiae bacterium]